MDIRLHHYADRRGISFNEASCEPWGEVERAFYIWSLNDERVKFEERKAQPL